jgi:hypothetical protein
MLHNPFQLFLTVSLHLHKLELHIGYVYGQTEKPPHASHYSPKFVPGARLPHAWIKLRSSGAQPQIEPLDISYVKELTPSEIDACRYSILDLCAFDTFTLFVGSIDTWAGHFEALQDALSDRGVKLNLFAADRDFEFANEQHHDLFSSGAGFGAGGGVLVRPDQHILGRFEKGDTWEGLKNALEGHLGF